ncbi:MAG: hypothetical protein DBX47_01895 [Clostridiales bacterium]|nr:MAG: hypothetical protein DBX47_01895 [Clostridiales bacterium]
MPKEYCYTDEINDDFAGVNKRRIQIDKNFNFANKNIFWKTAAFIVYRLFMTPFAAIFCKIKFGVRFKNKEVLNQYKKKGFFIYGNHTQIPADAFFPNMFLFPKKAYFIVHPDNIATRGTKNIMQMLGAIPIPTSISAMRPFYNAIEKRVNENAAVVVFPEAHIWPYYTKIRQFASVSFKYPVKLNTPVFCFTTTYRKRKFFKRPGITIYLDGPFYFPKEISEKQREQYLRNEVFKTMSKRAEKNEIEYIKYIKRS